MPSEPLTPDELTQLSSRFSIARMDENRYRMAQIFEEVRESYANALDRIAALEAENAELLRRLIDFDKSAGEYCAASRDRIATLEAENKLLTEELAREKQAADSITDDYWAIKTLLMPFAWRHYNKGNVTSLPWYEAVRLELIALNRERDVLTKRVALLKMAGSTLTDSASELEQSVFEVKASLCTCEMERDALRAELDAAKQEGVRLLSILRKGKAVEWSVAFVHGGDEQFRNTEQWVVDAESTLAASPATTDEVGRS